MKASIPTRLQGQPTPLALLALAESALETAPCPRVRGARTRGRGTVLQGTIQQVWSNTRLDLRSRDGMVYQIYLAHHPWVISRERWVLLTTFRVGQQVAVIGRRQRHTLWADRIEVACER